MLFLGPPFTAGYALNASLGAKARTPAVLGLALATSELLVLGAVLVIALFKDSGG